MSNYIYNPDSGELYHYGVKGMKWGVRRAQKVDRQSYRRNVRDLKKQKWDRYNDADEKHEERVIAINRKYGQHKNNFEGENARLKRKEKKAYNKELESAWDDYTREDDAARADYKAAKKQAKRDHKNAVARYNRDTTLTSQQRRRVVGATIAASILTTPLGGYVVGRTMSEGYRGQNFEDRRNAGKLAADRILDNM